STGSSPDPVHAGEAGVRRAARTETAVAPRSTGPPESPTGVSRPGVRRGGTDHSRTRADPPASADEGESGGGADRRLRCLCGADDPKRLLRLSSKEAPPALVPAEQADLAPDGENLQAWVGALGDAYGRAPVRLYSLA